MLIKAVFSGFGGQGVIMMGYLLATGGMYEGKNVTCLPSYGAEVRGGTANCTVVLSTEEIASPVASEPEFAILMNNPSLFRFQNQVQSGGTIFLNSSMIESRPIRGDLEIFEIPVNDLAKQLKANKVTNMIMLGAFIKKSGLVSLETMNHVLKDTFGNRNPAILKLNKAALLLGYNYLERSSPPTPLGRGRHGRGSSGQGNYFTIVGFHPRLQGGAFSRLSRKGGRIDAGQTDFCQSGKRSWKTF